MAFSSCANQWSFFKAQRRLILPRVGALLRLVNHLETRPIRFGIIGSLAVHVILLCIVAVWIGYPTIKRMVDTTLKEENAVTLVFPEIIEAPPSDPLPVTPPRSKEEPYIRTTQNKEASAPPIKTDFISDKNTAASAKLPAAGGGDPLMPTSKGIDIPTKELANRTYKDGEIKNDSAPIMTQPVTPAIPELKQTPDTIVAKKENSPSEVKMKELDELLQGNSPKMLPSEKRHVDEVAALASISKKIEPPKAPTLPLTNTLKPEVNAFQPETHTSNKDGGIDAIGSEDAVNAKATSMGAYRRVATSVVEKKWHALIRLKLDVVEPGNLSVRFYVNKNGKVEDARITYNRASPLLADVTLEAILMAEIPPIPKELLPVLDRERMEINYDVIIHP